MHDPTEAAAPDAAKQELRALAEAWSRALEARDIAGLTADYAPDVLFYDVKPPHAVSGVGALRANWQACLPHFPARFRTEHRDWTIAVEGDLAFAYGLHRVVPEDEPDHPAGATWIRVTVCYRRVEGRWRVVHEHASVPFDPLTRQVAFIADLDPQEQADG